MAGCIPACQKALKCYFFAGESPIIKTSRKKEILNTLKHKSS